MRSEYSRKHNQIKVNNETVEDVNKLSYLGQQQTEKVEVQVLLKTSYI